MDKNQRTLPTPLDLCILLAHETANILNADADAISMAERMQECVRVVAAGHDLTAEAAPLLAWMESEVESARHFTAAGQDTEHLISQDRLLPVPGEALQMEAVWGLFQTAIRQPEQCRQLLFDTARSLAEMGGLETMLLTGKVPAAGVLTVNDLRMELEELRENLQARQEAGCGPARMGLQ